MENIEYVGGCVTFDVGDFFVVRVGVFVDGELEGKYVGGCVTFDVGDFLVLRVGVLVDGELEGEYVGGCVTFDEGNFFVLRVGVFVDGELEGVNLVRAILNAPNSADVSTVIFIPEEVTTA